MPNEASRSAIFEDYANHCAQFNPSEASEAFPDYDLNIRPLLPDERDASILDLGCGMGQFLAYLKARGYERVTGIDLSRSQIDYCHAQGLANAQLVDDSIEFLAGQQQQFAAIVAIDVIEHIPKATLLPLLQAIYAALKPGGLFIMRVPNIAAAIGPWTRYMDITHELAFDERSAVQAMGMAGFATAWVEPLKTYYRRRWLGHAFEFIRRIFYALLKAIYIIQAPGTKTPTIFTIFIVGIGKKGQQ
jgi:2-polyprenyl-3-methyl-5-hydroxy-6-metoxy-1,4-benzoquinol methylase